MLQSTCSDIFPALSSISNFNFQQNPSEIKPGVLFQKQNVSIKYETTDYSLYTVVFSKVGKDFDIKSTSGTIFS